MTKRVVLAYSGGLDTSVAIGWIAEETGAEVIAVAMDVGQGGEDLNTIRQRALACGAVDAEVVDAREEFATGYCLPALRANALYMNRYPLVSALSRPLIVTHLARVARERGADAVAHGCTGKGNDQVRFEVGMASLAPEIEVLAPVRDSGMTRDKAIAFAEEKELPVNVTSRSPYSIDQNLWGRSCETGHLEDIWEAPHDDVWSYTQDPGVPRDPDELVISFADGIPVAIDGRPLPPLDIVTELNARAGAPGVGRVVMAEASRYVTGDVRLRRHGGQAVVTGGRSPVSLYDYGLATYDTGDTFDQSLAKGFVELWGLPSRVAAMREHRAGR